MNFGANLKALRKAAGLTQLEVAKRLGLTDMAISKFCSMRSIVCDPLVSHAHKFIGFHDYPKTKETSQTRQKRRICEVFVLPLYFPWDINIWRIYAVFRAFCGQCVTRPIGGIPSPPHDFVPPTEKRRRNHIWNGPERKGRNSPGRAIHLYMRTKYLLSANRTGIRIVSASGSK